MFGNLKNIKSCACSTLEVQEGAGGGAGIRDLRAHRLGAPIISTTSFGAPDKLCRLGMPCFRNSI